MGGAAPAIYAVGVCCPLGRTFSETRSAYRRGDTAFRKERALVGPDGFPPTLATVLPLAECRDCVERLLFLFDAALADARAAASALTEGPSPLRLMVQPWLDGQAMLAALLSAIRQRQRFSVAVEKMAPLGIGGVIHAADGNSQEGGESDLPHGLRF